MWDVFFFCWFFLWCGCMCLLCVACVCGGVCVGVFLVALFFFFNYTLVQLRKLGWPCLVME